MDLPRLSFHSLSPPLALLASEPARALVDFVSSRKPGTPRTAGDGHPVIVYPGLGAGPWSTGRLRSTLDAAGFQSIDWGFGQNRGPRGSLAQWLQTLAAAVESQRERHNRKVSLVGWSLGGIYAREVARAVPDAVRQVITLGSPFGAEAEATHAGWLYRLLSGSKPPQSQRYLEELKRDLPVPSTSVFSKSDGIVPWQGCLQKEGPLSENVEVHGVSHLGMGTNRMVLDIVAERLAQPEVGWKRRSPRGRRNGASAGIPGS